MKKLWRVIKAVNSAMIGVGKKEALVKDLDDVESSGPFLYILVGLIMTVIFIFAVIFAVQMVLSN